MVWKKRQLPDIFLTLTRDYFLIAFVIWKIWRINGLLAGIGLPSVSISLPTLFSDNRAKDALFSEI
jgi:hypothetical protein